MITLVIVLALARAYAASVAVLYLLAALIALLAATTKRKPAAGTFENFGKFLGQAWLWPIMAVRQCRHNRRLAKASL